MAIWRWSQKNKKIEWEGKLKRWFNEIATKSSRGLLVKVFFYSEGKRANGNYRCLSMHGFYNSERKFYNCGIKHIITLKIGPSAPRYDIFLLIAHEYRHYLQYLKYGHTMHEKINGRRHSPIQPERDAWKWSEKRVDELIGSRKLKWGQHHDDLLAQDYFKIGEVIDRFSSWQQ